MSICIVQKNKVMNKDRKLMLMVAIAAILCTIWAITIKDWTMTVLLILVALFSFYVIVFKFKNCIRR